MLLGYSAARERLRLWRLYMPVPRIASKRRRELRTHPVKHELPTQEDGVGNRTRKTTKQHLIVPRYPTPSLHLCFPHIYGVHYSARRQHSAPSLPHIISVSLIIRHTCFLSHTLFVHTGRVPVPSLGLLGRCSRYRTCILGSPFRSHWQCESKSSAPLGKRILFPIDV